jgi:hypothetical protein
MSPARRPRAPANVDGMHSDLHRELQNTLHEARLRAAAERRVVPPGVARGRRRADRMSRLAAAVARRVAALT